MLKEGLSIDTTFNPHQFSSDNTFKLQPVRQWTRSPALPVVMKNHGGLESFHFSAYVSEMFLTKSIYNLQIEVRLNYLGKLEHQWKQALINFLAVKTSRIESILANIQIPFKILLLKQNLSATSLTKCILLSQFISGKKITRSEC